MLSTSLATAVFYGMLASGSVATQPAWHTDYGKALVQATDFKKPVAVFIAQGGDGYAKLVKEGKIPTDAAKVLRQNYVCLYVDAASPTGKALTSSFQMSEGLVISSKAGTHQALRHEGRLTSTELTGYLTKYAESTQPVRTDYAGIGATPVASQGYSQPYYAQPRPVMNAMYGVRNLVIGGG